MKLQSLSNERLIRQHESRYIDGAEWPEVSDAEMDRYKKRIRETREEILRRLTDALQRDKVDEAKDDVVEAAREAQDDICKECGNASTTDDGKLVCEWKDCASWTLYKALAALDEVRE